MDPIGTVDDVLGRTLERMLVAHHRYRLRRLRRLDALQPRDGSPWCREPPAPRDGCSIEVLIDGAEVLGAIAEAIRGARRSVRIAGWHSAPHFALARGEPPTVLRELLAETVARGVDVRVLLWAGAPMRAFTPSLGGDRWDTPQHPARGRLGWHDAGTRLRGPIVADVAEHLDLRWTELTGDALPAVPVPAPAGDTTIQLLRTVPERVYDRLRDGAFGILEGYMRALHSARETIYLESQFLWLPEIVQPLSEKLRQPPSDRFRIVALLPSKANNGEEDTRGMLAYLADADPDQRRFLATTIDAMTGSTVDRLYVHAKIGIVDDRWLTIGSANLNAHSFFNDTEVNIQVCDEALARSTRLRLWSEHLGLPEDEIAGDPTDVIDGLWIPIARRERDRRRAGHPREHRLRELTPGSRKLERLLGPMDAIVVDG
jgi:phosphatidylserine/phosphatidylglycerophosphate/cardiolipin synthase-like enzyme